MKRKQWFTQKTPPTTIGFDHLVFDGSERYLAWASTEEDARLIAAAPELLDALMELADWYREHTGLPPAAANAAIAKATGGQP